MMQIIMAVVGMGLAAGLGLLVLNNVSLSVRAGDIVADRAMLDSAVAALEASVEQVPGSLSNAVPAGVYDADAGWYVLPANIGSGNVSSSGLPFIYCPVGRVSSTHRSTMTGKATASVSMPKTSYTIETYGGLVINSDLAINGSVESAMKPLAFLIAARGGDEAVPDCSEVKLQGSEAVVPGGVVRVVSEPLGYAVDRVLSQTFYVSANGTGSGDSAADPASIDDAFYYYDRFKPANFTVVVDGTVTASNGAFQALINGAYSTPGTSVKFVGSSGSARINASNYYWPLPKHFTLENVEIYGPRLQVMAGGMFVVSGEVRLTPIQSNVPAIAINPGRNLVIRDARLGMNTPNVYMIAVYGQMNVVNSTVYPFGARPQANFYLQYGRVFAQNSVFGQDPSTALLRPTLAGFYTNYWSELVTDDLTTITWSDGYGGCWSSGAGDQLVMWSPDAINARSGVNAESGYTAPSPTDMAATQTYQDQKALRLRARRQNRSNMMCV